MKSIYFILSLIFLSLASPVLANETIIDLTHPFNEKTIYWPTNKGFTLHKVGAGITAKGYFHAGYSFEAPEHGGTHLDAPYHFNENGWTVEKIPLDNLVGEACVVDVKSKVREANYQVTKNDLEQWEKKNGTLSGNCIVLFYTGWDKYWDNKKEYMGTDISGDVKSLAFPGIGKEAAEYLVMKKVKGVGLDTASLDAGSSNEFWAHRVLGSANIYGIENLMGLGQLKPRGLKIIVAPMKIEGGTGAPARVLILH